MNMFKKPLDKDGEWRDSIFEHVQILATPTKIRAAGEGGDHALLA
jgi:hypothetical protein